MTLLFEDERGVVRRSIYADWADLQLSEAHVEGQSGYKDRLGPLVERGMS